MSARILNGEQLAGSIRQDLTKQIATQLDNGNRCPGLAVILVGDDPSSALYVKLKRRDCAEVGIECKLVDLPTSTEEQELLDIIDALNADSSIDGILVQLPLPDHINDLHVTARILPRKDVDGVSPYNMGMLTLRQPAHRACTPKGVMSLLRTTEVDLYGAHAVVVGASNHVGRPMGLELLLAGCTVSTAHKFTRDTKQLVQQGDIVVSATGIAKLIKADWVKPGATVIDVGIERQADGSLVGDVDFESVKSTAGWITPVPGGVGPMTRVSILQNVLDSASRSPV